MRAPTPLRRITVLHPGAQTLIQDRGRPGLAHLGIARSGALDPDALALANRLVGNDPSAAGLEILLGGLTVRADTACTVAVAGPTVALRLDGHLADSHRPLRLARGTRLEVAAPDQGLRTYLAVSGGIAVTPTLGSRSTDVLSGLGPEPVRAGDVLALGAATIAPAAVDVVAPTVVTDPLAVPVLLGPRDEWIADVVSALRDADWTVTSSSNRIGLRLDGHPLRRADGFVDRELASEATVPGAVQVPPDGQPVVFLADHPVTGGYPVVGVVLPRALSTLAQARPGSRVRFVLVSVPRGYSTP